MFFLFFYFKSYNAIIGDSANLKGIEEQNECEPHHLIYCVNIDGEWAPVILFNKFFYTRISESFT